jgi:hypothetical protein
MMKVKLASLFLILGVFLFTLGDSCGGGNGGGSGGDCDCINAPEKCAPGDCPPSPPPPPPIGGGAGPTGFTVMTCFQVFYIDANQFGPLLCAPFGFSMDWIADFPSGIYQPSGSVYSVPPTITAYDGTYTVSDGRTPATWSYTWHGATCDGMSDTALIYPGDTYRKICVDFEL